jgi:hypothetical protein
LTEGTKMKVLWPNRKGLLAVVGILLAILIVKIVLFLTTKPRVTTDYVAKLNQLTCPANYDPNENAASSYQKAFDVYIEMPAGLKRQYVNWPTDFNSADQTLLTQWIESNLKAIEYFKVAADKPYYWLERKAKQDSDMRSLDIPEFSFLHQLAQTIIWDAKLKVINGNHAGAFENVAACFSAGKQKCRAPCLALDRQCGLSLQRMAMYSAVAIMIKIQIPSSELFELQNKLQAIGKCSFDASISKLALYDILQRTYVYKLNGNGRLAWSQKQNYCISSPDIPSWLIIKDCFIGPTENEIKKQIEEFYEKLKPLATMTPWQLEHTKPNYFKNLDMLQFKTLPLYVYGIDYRKDFLNYHAVCAQMEALITTIAILRFKQDKGHFPDTLNDLLKDKYISELPPDPYSDKSLIYKPMGNDFQLYSVGSDFSDNGGFSESVKELLTQSATSRMPGMSGGIPQKDIDIIYWPVLHKNI